MIIFDFDGVIIDSTKSIYLTFVDVMKEYDLPFTQEDYKQSFQTNIYDSLRQKGITDLDTFSKKFAAASAKHEKDILLFPGIKELLISLKEPLAIITSNEASNVKKILQRFDIDIFVAILGRETHHSKQKKFEMLPDARIFVTDTAGDIEEAIAHNIPTIGVTWGVHKKEQLQKSTFIAHSTEELKALLEKAGTD